MNHLSFDQNRKYTTALLIKASGLKREGIQRVYVDECGLSETGLIAFDLDYGGKSKPSAVVRKAYLEKLLKGINKLGITHIVCADTEYFKTLTKKQQVEPCYGYVHPCVIEGYEHLHVSISMNHRILFHKPDLINKIQLSVNAVTAHQNGTYVEIGSDVIHSEYYPETLSDIKKALADLHQYPALSADFEAFSLKHYTSGLGTVGFAWDKHNGMAFNIDYLPKSEPVNVLNAAGHKTKKWEYADQVLNQEVRALLKEFFETYKGKLIWHNISYDATIAVFNLWMDDLLDQEGMLTGIEFMTKNFDCTQLITYLATNSCAGNKLSLKEQAHEYLGAYAQEEIDDIRLIEPKALLRYNLSDCLGTWFVHEKHYPTMVADLQETLYIDLFKEFVVDILQMQLTGMCLSMPKVLEAEIKLQAIKDKAYKTLIDSPIAKKFIADNITKEVTSRNAAYKKKVITAAEAEFIFNPNSNPQMQDFLYDLNYMGLAVVDKTKTKLPATGGKTLTKLVGMSGDQDEIELLTALIDYAQVGKILSSFIPAFKSAPLAPDGNYYLYGSYKLGGTVSGRLSSSNPNMQNIPSGSTYGKIIKECFIAAKGWLFCGADSASLEDRIDTLLTKDPNKLKIYIGEAVYEVIVDGTCHHIRQDATVDFDGTLYTGKEFYEMYGNS